MSSIPSYKTASLAKICNVILDKSSSRQNLQYALENFTQLCSQVTHISPNPTFDAWAEDTYLEQGVAINPNAAAYCIKDYQRSITFIRGVHDAILLLLDKPKIVPINMLYAGCGPFATLLMPLLGKYQHENFNLSRFNINLLDIHQASLDSTSLLLSHFGINTHNICLIQANACTYQHPCLLDLIIAETMQKSLEQEPQFTVTANLAPQLHAKGIFIPESIDVSLCLVNWEKEKTMHKNDITIDHNTQLKIGERYSLGTLLHLEPKLAASQYHAAHFNDDTLKFELGAVKITIPDIEDLKAFDVLFLTRIQVFDHHQLLDYESEITLPSKCETITSLTPGTQYLVSYQLGNYPRFNVQPTQN